MSDTTQAVRRPTVALELPKSVPPRIVYAQGIVKRMTANPAFANPTPALAVITSAVDDLQTAEASALARTKGAAAIRNAKRTRCSSCCSSSSARTSRPRPTRTRRHWPHRSSRAPASPCARPPRRQARTFAAKQGKVSGIGGRDHGEDGGQACGRRGPAVPRAGAYLPPLRPRSPARDLRDAAPPCAACWGETPGESPSRHGYARGRQSEHRGVRELLVEGVRDPDANAGGAPGDHAQTGAVVVQRAEAPADRRDRVGAAVIGCRPGDGLHIPGTALGRRAHPDHRRLDRARGC